MQEKENTMKNILEFDYIKAREYFLKEESYFKFELPKYFSFQSVITKVSQKIENKLLSDFYGSFTNPETEKEKATIPCDFENVNYKFLNNKDGKFAWRPFQLIHPALYVSLVHRITEKDNWKVIVDRFKIFGEDHKIKCYSVPIESESELSDKAITVSHWWQEIEQRSIELALKYDYILHTDISDCYGSIYTHSIAWALHTKNIAKRDRNKKTLVGNIIDKHLQNMSFGQTNGIPQGSVLMDFIAEMVLGFADLELSKRLKDLISDEYTIIRYRDDYRIFSNNPQTAELITKYLTEILFEFGLKLNAHKTFVSHNVVCDSIKPDKLFWISNKRRPKSLQEHLLLIHKLSQEYPNSGSLAKALDKYFNRIYHIKKTNQNIPVLISIVVDIAFKNPRTYPIVSAILSKFFSLIQANEKIEELLDSINKRFDKIPNTGHLQIWLQRVILKMSKEQSFEETLCKKVNDFKIIIWNSDWLNNDLKALINSEPIVDEKIINEVEIVIDSEEVQLFVSKQDYPY